MQMQFLTIPHFGIFRLKPTLNRVMETSVKQSTKPSVNPWQELIFTVVLPSLALEYLSSEDRLGPFGALCASLVFPILFGVYSWQKKLQWNIFSIIGLGTVILSGILGLFEMSSFWIGLKESSISIILALAFPLSHFWKKPLIGALLLQPQIINTRAIQKVNQDPAKASAYESLLKRCSWLICIGMVACSVGNFYYALYILGDAIPGSEAFVKGLSTLNWMSMVVIGVPMMLIMMGVFFHLLRGIEEITKLERDDLLNPGKTVRRQVHHSNSDS